MELSIMAQTHTVLPTPIDDYAADIEIDENDPVRDFFT